MISAEEFDGDYRIPLYEMLIALNKDIPTDPEVENFRTGLSNLLNLADDYRVELLDREDSEPSIEE